MEWMEDVRKNPFHVLGASPRDTREELIRRQQELALFGEEEAGGQALAALLHPLTRLEAEIRWFPQTEPETVRRLIRFLDKGGQGQTIICLPTESVLARFQALRLQMPLFQPENREQLTAVFHSLAAVADGLFPRQVTEEINADRRRSGFVQLEHAAAEISSRIRQLLQETVNFFLDRYSADQKEWKKLSEAFKKEYQDRKSPYHNSYLIELAGREAAFRSGPV